MTIVNRQKIERRIVSRAIRDLLDAGYRIDVDDGDQGYFVTDAIDPRVILAEMFQMDDDRVFAHHPDQGRPTGWLYFVYGNDGWDVLCDYTTNLEPYIGPTLALIDRESERA